MIKHKRAKVYPMSTRRPLYKSIQRLLGAIVVVAVFAVEAMQELRKKPMVDIEIEMDEGNGEMPYVFEPWRWSIGGDA